MNERRGEKKKSQSTVDVGGGRSERTKRTTAKMCFVFVTVVSAQVSKRQRAKSSKG